MKKNFNIPKIEIVRFDEEDILTGSSLQQTAYESLKNGDGSIKLDDNNKIEEVNLLLAF